MQVRSIPHLLRPTFLISVAMSTPCPLCPEFGAESTTTYKPNGETVEVGTRAKATIVDASQQRQDGREQYISTAQPLVVHVSCRMTYTRKNSIVSHRKTLSSTLFDGAKCPCLRSTEQSSSKFDIADDCLICGEVANENRKKKGSIKDSV